MDCKETIRWYERKWEEDRQRWEEKKKALEKGLEEQAAEILILKEKLKEQESQTIKTLVSQIEVYNRLLEEERTAHSQCKEAYQRLKAQLEITSRPALGEGFFRYLARELELWDRALIEESRLLNRHGIEPWLSALWKERKDAFSQALASKVIDWRRVRTGMVLEWALLTWLEGVRDG